MCKGSGGLGDLGQIITPSVWLPFISVENEIGASGVTVVIAKFSSIQNSIILVSRPETSQAQLQETTSSACSPTSCVPLQTAELPHLRVYVWNELT